MKKLVVVLMLLGAGGYVAWAHWLKPERRACAKMAELCGDKTNVDKCTNDLGDLKKSLGTDVADKFADCTAKATTCPEAAGCLVGAGMKGVGDAMNNFMKGMGNALSK